MATNNGTSDYYKGRGMTRYTLILPEVYKAKIETIAKQYKLTQGQVIEVMLDQMLDENEIAPFFIARAETKTDGRSKGTPKKKILESMKDLSSEQLAIIEAQISAMKAQA
jgi:hypothetical protein